MTQSTKLMFAAVMIATLFLGACEPAATATAPPAPPQAAAVQQNPNDIPTVLVVPVPVGEEDMTVVPKVVKTQPVDIAICLDTSGSMSGLINAARQKLWAIVNELATAKPRPRLRVALYQYGGGSLGSASGWVRQECELTDDLDEVYSKLHKLRASGSTEYVARVTNAALTDLDWSSEKNALKIIIVAGNESARQDPKMKLEAVCKKTIAAGIMINTIYCGPEAAGRSSGWADAASWADGEYAAIDQNTGTVAIKMPYDKKIAKLGADLNTTYVAYGKAGEEKAKKQKEQDANAQTAGKPAAAERAVTKSTGLYVNTKWDLVDAVKNKKDFDIAKVETKDLPAVMKPMTVPQRKKFVATQAQNRAAIQKEIRELDKKRQVHIKAAMAAPGAPSAAKSFDQNLRNQIRLQAKKKGFEFKSESKVEPKPATKTEVKSAVKK